MWHKLGVAWFCGLRQVVEADNDKDVVVRCKQRKRRHCCRRKHLLLSLV